MIKVGLCTTIAPERCGVRVYCEELIRNTRLDNPDVEFTLIGRPFDGASIVDRAKGMDIFHINHVWSLFGDLGAHHIQQMREMGIKTICTFNDSSSDNRGSFTLAFDKVVVHQETSDGFTRIYHGIPWLEHLPEYDGSMKDFVGTSGFPLAFKNYPLAARLAKAVDKKLYAILPSDSYGDVNGVVREIQKECPGSIVRMNFPSHDEILTVLHQCAFSLFPYAHEGSGIGGSARVGIGAQRPVVISNVSRFADILGDDQYRNEFYVIEDPYPVFQTALPVVEKVVADLKTGTAKIPVKTLEDMNWRKSSQAYVNLYRELLS